MHRTLFAASLMLIPALGACAHKTTQADYAAYSSVRVIFFTVNSADLTPDTYAIVQEAAIAAAKTHPQSIQIEGFSDSVGSEAANLQLSEHRTSNVTKTLIDLGVDPRIITTVPKGPAIDEYGPTGDRRVVIEMIGRKMDPTDIAVR